MRSPVKRLMTASMQMSIALSVEPGTISYGRHWLATIIIRSPIRSAYATCTSMVLVSLKPGLLSRPEKFSEMTGMKP